MQLSDAESLFHLALEQSPDDCTALSNLAGCLNRQGRHTGMSAGLVASHFSNATLLRMYKECQNKRMETSVRSHA